MVGTPIIKMTKKQKKAKQKNLYGDFAVPPPVTVPVPFYKQQAKDFWRLEDSVWQTLNFFYMCPSNHRGFSFSDLDKRHYLGKRKCKNTIINNIQRLLKEDAIKLIAENYGPNKCMKIYKITDKGEMIYEKFLSQRDL